jgi:hypothetical protein
MTRLFTYVITQDGGFAPNPFHGVLTLNCCKPEIRKLAEVGDWVAGFILSYPRAAALCQLSADRAHRALQSWVGGAGNRGLPQAWL